MILACQNVSKAFGTNQILKEISFHIEEREKAAIVGINGAGKSTLLKIVIGEMPPDSGEVILSKNKSIGYLSQHQDYVPNHTIYDEMLEVKKDIIDLDQKIRKLELDMKHATGSELESMLVSYTKATHEFESANGYAYKSEITGVLKGLGFFEDDFDKKIQSLSGGQKTRVALGKLLLTKPDVLLLDEPTNHLDMKSISWLETFLLNYSGSIIIVSHDRYFLDKVVSKVVELDASNGYVYNGNYSSYAQKREVMRANMMKQFLNQQKEIKHQEAVIEKLKSFNREKSIKRAESREKMLDKVEVLEKPKEVRADMRIHLEPQILSGNDVLTVDGLSKSYGDLHLFKDLHMEISRGERVALIGDNGTGKTTILKIINKFIKADSGRIVLGAKVHVGYYDQEHQVLSPNKTIFNELSDSYPTLTHTRIRNVLAAFLFTADDVFKRICDLSGGERGRVSLAKLMLSNANFLILDEPTNHLDINSKEILEEALSNYTGTILYVSHDRYFINKTATRILDLNHEEVESYKGNFDYYMDEKAKLASRILTDGIDASSLSKEESDNKEDWKKNKEEQAKQRKRTNDLKKVEDDIHQLETQSEELDTMMQQENVVSNMAMLLELTNKKANIDTELLELYEKWEELAL